MMEGTDTLVIHIDFDNPEEISMGEGAYDKLKVNLNTEVFNKAFVIIGDNRQIVEVP